MIEKISEITVKNLVDYCRITEPQPEDITLLESALNVAKTFIAQYTGRTLEELDAMADVVIVVLIMCSDMYDTRSLVYDRERVHFNYIVETILNLHQVNLL